MPELPTKLTPENITLMVAITEQTIENVLKEHKVTARISPKILHDIAEYFLRDMEKLLVHQREAVTITKFIGYWAFWIRKLKPISNAFYKRELSGKNKNHDSLEIFNINELISINLAIKMLIRTGNKEYECCDSVRNVCDAECDKQACVRRYCRKFFLFNNRYNYKYLLYAMRYRTYGPHHITKMLDHILFAACDKTRNGDQVTVAT